MTIETFSDNMYAVRVWAYIIYYIKYTVTTKMKGYHNTEMDAGGTVPDILVAGFTQSKKLIESNAVKRAYVASDADTKIIESVKDLCHGNDTELVTEHTKHELGVMCGIDVDCAVCVALN